MKVRFHPMVESTPGVAATATSLRLAPPLNADQIRRMEDALMLGDLTKVRDILREIGWTLRQDHITGGVTFNFAGDIYRR